MNRAKWNVHNIYMICMCVIILGCAVILGACGGSESTDTSGDPGTTAAVSGQSAAGSNASGNAVGADESLEEDGNSVSGDAVLADQTEQGSELYQLSCQLAKQIVSGLTSQVVTYMTPDLASQMTAENLQKSWEGESEGLSGFQGIENVVERVGDHEDTVTVTFRYANNQGRSVKFTFNDDKQVKDIWFDKVDLPSLAESGESKDTGNGSADGQDTENKNTESFDTESPSATPMPSYDYEETSFSVGRDPYKLDGMLTIPTGADKPPVVILVDGRDDADMDGTIGTAGNTPLRDIAYGLANKGVASLRYNRRKQQYEKQISSLAGTYDTYLKDLSYVVNDLYNDSRIDKERIFVLAEGKAADALPALVKMKNKRIAGVLLVGARPASVAEKDYTDSKKDITAYASYWMDENSTLPMFILRGEADFETSHNEYEKWRTVLQGRAHIDYREYKNLNHYLIKTNNQKDATDYDTVGKVSTEVCQAMAKWVLNQD